MAEVTIHCQSDFKTSRSGRLLVPRLKCWTGERIIVNKKGIVEIVDSASPDCTGTFQTDRKLFRNSSIVSLSQSCNLPKTAKSPKARVLKRSSESPLTSTRLKRTKIKEKTNIDFETLVKSPSSSLQSLRCRDPKTLGKIPTKAFIPQKCSITSKPSKYTRKAIKFVADSPKKNAKNGSSNAMVIDLLSFTCCVAIKLLFSNRLNLHQSTLMAPSSSL